MRLVVTVTYVLFGQTRTKQGTRDDMLSYVGTLVDNGVDVSVESEYVE